MTGAVNKERPVLGKLSNARMHWNHTVTWGYFGLHKKGMRCMTKLRKAWQDPDDDLSCEGCLGFRVSGVGFRI